MGRIPVAMYAGTDFTFEGVVPVIGLAGVLVYVSSYTLMQTGFIRGRSRTYASLVILAASCVALSATSPWNPAVFSMQMFYIGISIIGIARIIVNTRMLRFSVEERAFIRKHLPDLRAEDIRPFLQIGQWRDIPEDTMLAKEDATLDRLYYLASGTATVTVGDRVVGTCRDCFVGELTLLTGGPATATVVTNDPARVLEFDAKKLQNLLRKQSEIKLAVIAGFADATKALLVRRNREANLTVGTLDHVDGDGAMAETGKE